MINEVRICEIQEEIRKIEEDQDEAEKCIKKFIHECENIYEDTQNSLRMMCVEFEACLGDAHMINLVEERYKLLLQVQCDSDNFVADIKKEQIEIKTKCRSVLEELEREKQRLEVMPI